MQYDRLIIESRGTITELCVNDIVIDEIAAYLIDAVPDNVLFRTGETVVELVHSDAGTVHARPVNTELAQDLIGKFVQIIVPHPSLGREISPVPTMLCKPVMQRLRDQLPLLHGIVAHPILTPTGEIITTSGYNVETGCYVALSPALEGIAVPSNPTYMDIITAREQIAQIYTYRALRGMEDQARYVATLLTSMTRSCVDVVPLVYANGFAGQGDGHTIMREMAAMLTGLPSGSRDHAVSNPTVPDYVALNADDLLYWFSYARTRAETVVCFLTDFEQDIPLAMHEIMTQTVHQGTVHQESDIAGMRNLTVPMCSRTDFIVDDRLRGCVLPVSLARHGVSPFPRPGWTFGAGGAVDTHSDAVTFDTVRAQVYGGLLTLIRAWQCAGKPMPKTRSTFHLDMQSWYNHVAGILEHAGYASISSNMPLEVMTPMTPTRQKQSRISQSRISRSRISRSRISCSEFGSRRSRNEFIPDTRWVDILASQFDGLEDQATWGEVDAIIAKNGKAFAEALGVGRIREERTAADWLHRLSTSEKIIDAVGGKDGMFDHPRTLRAHSRTIANVLHPYTNCVGVAWETLADVQQIADDIQQALHELGYSPTSKRIAGNTVPRRVVVLDEAHSLYLPETTRYGNSYNISILFVRHDIVNNEVVRCLQRDCHAGVGTLPSFEV